jgi:hypothetical protein
MKIKLFDNADKMIFEGDIARYTTEDTPPATSTPTPPATTPPAEKHPVGAMHTPAADEQAKRK